MYRAGKLDVDLAFVLVIDLQEKLLPLIPDQTRVLEAVTKLLRGANVFGLPVVATEQYVKGLGPTDPGIRDRCNSLRATVVEKPTFSACGWEPLRRTMREIDRPQVIVSGIEAHICVLQTALDLRTMDYDVFVCADAVGSRGRLDAEMGIERMRQAGAQITTVESVLFELCGRCDTKAFKEMLEIIKSSPPPEG
ncbi:MAG: hydrolase [Phycisphaerae bacterium]